MPTVSISNSLIAKLQSKNKQCDVRDSRLQGFMVRVYPSGNMTYAAQYVRGKRVTLGKLGVLTPAQAREKANTINRTITPLRSAIPKAVEWGVSMSTVYLD